jgi:hypothetical protein
VFQVHMNVFDTVIIWTNLKTLIKLYALFVEFNELVLFVVKIVKVLIKIRLFSCNNVYL